MLNNKVLAILVLGIILVGIFTFVSVVKQKVEVTEGEVYQGPVRPTDDEAYFRQTGITKPIGSEE